MTKEEKIKWLENEISYATNSENEFKFRKERAERDLLELTKE